MLPTSETACFLIADISGYTQFLAAAELEHAQDIIADLMDTMLKGLKPPFRLAKFEGDAMFLYAPGAAPDGALLLDTIEGAYFRFRRRLRDVRRASTCECQACAAMAGLDVKFVAHHGAMVKQRMGGREELAGRDVILVHRLLKNDAKQRLGGHAYALLTEDCTRATRLDPAASGLLAHAETVDIIGPVPTWLRDLETAWQEEANRKRVVVAPEDAYVTWTFDLVAPREAVWEHLNLPGLREGWWPSDGIEERVPKGRRGVGTTNHCMHGKDAVIEETLDWRPPDYVTVGIQLPVPGSPRIVMTRALQEMPGGVTRLEMRVARPRPKDRAFFDQAGAKFHAAITAAMRPLQAMLDAAAAAPPVIDEPPAPASRGRFLDATATPRSGPPAA